MLTPNTALITGASSGIGATYADHLARRGHDLILVARDAARLEALARRLRDETGRSVEALPADRFKKADLLRLELRRNEVNNCKLVNNAGNAAPGPTLGTDIDRLKAMVQLNVLAALRLNHAAVQGFVDRGQGTLINIASVLGLVPERFNATYSGTKAFLLKLSVSLLTELHGRNIRIQSVRPGATRTEIWGKVGINVDAMAQE